MPVDLEPLAELVARVDLGALVSRDAGPPRHGKWTCPLPAHHDTRASFGIYTDTSGVQRAKCYSACGEIGDALAYLQWLRGYDKATAATELRRFIGEPEPEWGNATKTKPTTSALYKATPGPAAARVTTCNTPPPITEPARPPAEVADRLMAEYLKARGWPEMVRHEYRLEVVLDAKGCPRIRHPFLVPTSEGGLVVASWQDRAIKTEPKWLAATGRPLPIYNVATLEADVVRAVVICEGPADTITASLALRTRPEVILRPAEVAVVGVAGTQAWKPEYADLMAGLVVVIATDNDDPGRKLAAEIGASLHGIAARLLAVDLAGHNDLTDAATAMGLDALGELLVAGLPASPMPSGPTEALDEIERRQLAEEW